MRSVCQNVKYNNVTAGSAVWLLNVMDKLALRVLGNCPVKNVWIGFPLH